MRVPEARQTTHQTILRLLAFVLLVLAIPAGFSVFGQSSQPAVSHQALQSNLISPLRSTNFLHSQVHLGIVDRGSRLQGSFIRGR